MRILLVTETFFPASDATTTTVKALADGLIDRGHEVRFVAPAPGLGCYRGSAVVRISPLAQPGAQVRAAVDAFRPDVVVATSPATTPGGLGRKALKHCRATGVRSVVLQQQPVPDLAWDYWRTRVAERADAVVVTARWMSAHLEALGVRTTTWLPGVDTDAFTPALRDEWLHRHWSRASSKDGPLVVVGFVGSLHKRHGVRRLAALAQVPGIRPVVVGEGPQREWLQSRLPGARFTGVLGSGDLAVALASTDVVVHPGEHETCSHVLREAGASGVPVVGPRAGGAREVVRHLETGLLHEPGDAHALARAVAAVAGDPRRALLGERGREVALERTWAVAVDELEALLRRTTGVVTAG
ncbi:phosphatidylinositol alpha 1,6-mannosyltransferase [Nocardioides marinisabuli]|uniref:Phosphatidylinositol alpha 1,6-mannosyltransferase n=1 Tax=Nocardioides marinisabuli TaxID=419476 RepID=A0A7Y9EYL1_9ACTN|nr:glycosyltransferase [Nocardioides marinisabuli]NYD56096.1 phosphatidylinositol alpha 1,6-mannosyltransferase [Nocardioides marinisabuli]